MADPEQDMHNASQTSPTSVDPRDLRANWSASEATITRTAFLVALVITIFLLIRENVISSISISGLQIANRPFIETAIPPVVAYLTYVISQQGAIAARLATWYRDLGGDPTLTPPGSFVNSRIFCLRPPEPKKGENRGILAGFRTVLSKVGEKKNRTINAIVAYSNMMRFGVYVTGPGVFLIYAIIVLWVNDIGSAQLRVMATVATGVLLLATIPYLVLTFLTIVEDVTNFFEGNLLGPGRSDTLANRADYAGQAAGSPKA